MCRSALGFCSIRQARVRAYPPMNPSIHPSIHPSTHPFIHPSSHAFIHSSNSSSLRWSVYSSRCPSMHVYTHVHMRVCMCICRYRCMHTYVWVYIYILVYVHVLSCFYRFTMYACLLICLINLIILMYCICVCEPAYIHRDEDVLLGTSKY